MVSSSSSTSTIRIAAIIIVPRNRRPTAAMAWLLAIYFIPIIGVLLFLLIGNPRLPRKRRRSRSSINEYIHDDQPSRLDFGTLRPNAPPWYTSLVTLNRNLGAMPLAGDNAAHLIPTTRRASTRWPTPSAARSEYVHVEFYILQSDAVDRQLLPRARRGMRARRHGAGPARPLGQPRQAVLQADAQAGSPTWARSGS